MLNMCTQFHSRLMKITKFAKENNNFVQFKDGWQGKNKG